MSARILPLQVEGLTFRYGRQAVLRGVDFEVAAGEVVALLGPNGAGKTTLFRLLTGAAQPESGHRRFAGRAVDEVDAELRARFAHLAHQPQVYPLLTARENVELFMRLAGRGGDAAERCLRQLGLADAMDRRVGTFSRGMAQRVALARALAQAPELFILDEPFTALDPEGRRSLVNLLRAQAEGGAGVLVASHDLDAVAAAADRGCVLREGRIVARIARAGRPAELFRADLSAALTGEGRPAEAVAPPLQADPALA